MDNHTANEEHHLLENNASRERLNKVLASLRNEDFVREVSRGWTIAATLTHLAFWDNYYLAFLTRWEQTGYETIHGDVEAINSALRPIILSVDGSKAKELVLNGAEAIDRKVAEINSDLRSRIFSDGHERVLRRAMHRNEHLDEIEKVLSNKH